MTYHKFLLTCCLLFFASIAFSQVPVPPEDSLQIPDTVYHPSGRLRIESIQVSGNRRTRLYIILREIPFHQGDSLNAASLFERLEQARRQVHNLNLFSEVTVTLEMRSAHDIVISIVVREKWYIYPTPQFQLADRNFNEWWKTYHADFNRVVYGLKFSHYNFSGRGDQLRVFLLNGYARNISFSYSTPSSKNSFTKGFRISGGYTDNREISYKTTKSNALAQFKKPGFVRTNVYGSISYQSRQGFFKRHFYTVTYNYVRVNDSIIEPAYNPNYFNSRKTAVGILDLAYSYSYANTDNNNYPLDGKSNGFSIVKRGFGWKGGVNMLSLSGVVNRYLPHGHNWYSAVQAYGKMILPFTQAYINQRSIGYSDFYLRGLEYYVIDGVAAAVARYTLKKKLFAFDVKMPFRIRSIPKIPVKAYGKAYGDAGYSYIKPQFDTRLNNRLLYTSGFGIDILSVWDSNVALEYSFNQLGENGLFLHAKIGL